MISLASRSISSIGTRPTFRCTCGLSRGECRLHLSEHHGDGAPGAHFRVSVEGIEEFHEQLLGKAYRYARPGLEVTPWAREIRIADPFGNRVVFFEPKSDG